MTPADSYRAKAAELLATAAINPARAAQWQHLSRCYLRLAEQAEQNRLQDLWLEVGPKPRLGGEGA